MGTPVLILGESGSGKSYSLKQFDGKEISVFSVEKGRLPFKSNIPVMKNATYEAIQKTLSEPTKRAYAIDDSQYLLVNEFFDHAKETGYNKFTDMALNFRNLIHMINKDLPDDVIVYFLHHVEKDADGMLRAKTIGKMLSEKLTVEGCFDIVLLTETNGDEHKFITQSNGFSTAKSPEGMFEKEIPNDLKAVDSAIREYYGFEPLVPTTKTTKAKETK